MRVRKKKNGAQRIEACSELLIGAPELLAEPSDNFENKDRPLHLEIGCGKGNFAVGMARKFPEYNFIALEKVADVCCVALEKAKNDHGFAVSDNLRFFIGDAKILSESMKPHSVDCIYLNFSDPWPKKGHAKRRLTHVNYLKRYKHILKDGGELIFKTDNVGLFDFSLEQFEEFGLELVWSTRDLHNSDRAEGNVVTEYEKNFSGKGFTINSAIVKF